MSTLLLAACLALVAAPQEKKPAPAGNVVVIVLDDVGVDLVGAYDGYFRSTGRAAGVPARTPAIDQLLAARGVTFANAWATPLCSPTRAQILTGRAGFRTGIGHVLPFGEGERQDRNAGLSLAETTLPTVLHGAKPPYRCAAVGKWHLASATQLAVDLRHPLGTPAGRWFDLYAGSLFNLRRPSGVERAGPLWSQWRKCYATAIDDGSNPCAPGELPCEVAMVVPPLADYPAVDTTDDAIYLARTLPEPWFLYVGLSATHAPAELVPPGLPRAEGDGFEAVSSPCEVGSPPSEPRLVRCMLEEADAQIARLVLALDLRDTTVILIGDNGTDAGAVLPPYESSHAKGTIYQGGVHVPLIVRGPRVAEKAAGSVCTALVGATDVFATVVELAGLAPRATPGVDSLSLVPYLDGETRPLRATLYTEQFEPNFTPDPETGWLPDGYQATRHAQALRDARFKLIRRTTRSRSDATQIRVVEELYDLLEGGPPVPGSEPPVPSPDPHEQHDLLGEPIAADSAAGIALARLRAELDARYPTVVE